MKNAKMKERMQTKLQQKQQQQPDKQSPPVAVSSNAIRQTTAVYTSASGEQIQQTPRTAKPIDNIVLDVNVNTTTSQSTETGYEPGNVAQKKKKKNKNKK